MTGQSKRHSFYESLVNIAVGYGIALATQLTVFPALDIEVRLDQNIIIGAIFTVISLIRSYCIRRFWNWVHVRQAPPPPPPA